MYLKTVEIVGYKSFATKTRLELQPGITGIIGPNGCGKSNIMESVRWCLGEMSWKSLRADSMVDVIFAGTAKRSPLSMTEVTLVFDNATSQLPVQFSEVTVSRRIFRSGESEYYLNKTQCRLRDIRELFLDTGVGGDGYAVIDQGGVEWVISAKPVDRRALFEEAAGVAKYKAKREEAIRKLERVEADMGRLNDSLALIEEQVRKLDSAARKAKLYKKYKEELAALEAAHILEQLSQLEKDVAALSELMRPVEERLGAKRTELTAENANHAALSLERAGQNNLVVEANQRVSDVAGKIAALQVHIDSALREIEGYDKRRQSCEAESAQAKAELALMDPKMDQARREQEAAEAELAAGRAEFSGFDAVVAKAEADAAAGQAQAAELKSQALAVREEGLEQSRRLSGVESSLSHQMGKVSVNLRGLVKDQANAEACEKSLAEARASLDVQSGRRAQARAAFETLEAQTVSAERRTAALAEEAQRLHSELVTTRAKAQAVSAQGEQNPYWAGAQAVLSSGVPGIVGTVRQLLRVPEEQRQALEDALGERLFAVVCEDSKAARDAVEFLNASQKGRARFLVLSSLPAALSEKAYPEEAKPLLRAVEFDARFEVAVRYLLQESYCLGKVLFGDHWVAGGSAPQERPVSLADFGELNAAIASLGIQHEERLTLKTQAQHETEQLQKRLREAAQTLNEEVNRETALKTELQHREQSLKNSQDNVAIATEDSAAMLAEMALTMEEINAARYALRGSKAREEALRAQEEEAAARIASLKEELARRSAERDSISQKVKGLEDKVALLEKAFSELAVAKEKLEAALSRRSQELVELAQSRKAAAERGACSREELSARNAEQEVLKQEAAAAFKRLDELNNAVTAKERTIRLLQAEAEAAKDELQGHEVKMAQHKTRLEGLKTNLWDSWQLTFEEAKQKHAGAAVDPEKLETLRKRVANMGDINMAAPEEYEALSQRQAFLATQLEDLKKAKEDLAAAIAKINASTRENFRQTFVEVREQFRRLYGVLFEGGEADLVLENPEDILETGVEIKAQPPGKRLQSISLLSGGEKTLTAIALLFAFFMVKPSPFCMLDEADAALDDANIGRFVALLKEFQSRSQFLIVSHNKRTMEAADVIYGVTMEEMGVSQLVSVDFRKKSAEPAPAPAAVQAAPETPAANPA